MKRTLRLVSYRFNSQSFQKRTDWNKHEDINKFIRDLERKFNLISEHDWDNISRKQIISLGGSDLLNTYSLYDIKCLGFPQGKFSPPKLQREKGFWNKKENIDAFIDKIRNEFNLKTFNDWNSLKQKQIQNLGGERILKLHSLYDIKCMGFPEGKLNFKKKITRKQIGYWENEKNITEFLRLLKNNLNLNSFEDWNSLTKRNIEENGGSRLLKYKTMYDIKCLGFPEGKFNNMKKASNYWNQDVNVENFLLELKEKLNLISFDDWNSLTQKQIISNGGRTLLRYFSLFDLKCLGFPDGKNQFIKPKKSVGFWNNKENVTKFLTNLSESLNLRCFEDWNNLTRDSIISFGGSSIFHKYSLFELKCLGFPEGKFIDHKPIGYWKDKNNIVDFLENLKEKLNIISPSDWNNLSREHIISNGGATLLHIYSIFELKCIGCPEGAVLFDNKRKSPGFWDEEENIQNFLSLIAEKLNLNTREDWNRLSTTQIQEFGGSGLLSKFSKEEIIQKKFCSSDNRSSIDNTGSIRSAQRWLFLQIQKLFLDEEIVEDYFHSELSRKTGTPIQFDIYLTKRKLAFEYHGQQHYEEIAAFASLEMYKLRDKEKIKICLDFGIQLIIVPYWWDNQLDSLKETIQTCLKKQDKIL